MTSGKYTSYRVERIYQKDILKIFSEEKEFHGFLATRSTQVYELSEKAVRIDAKNKYEFVRQMYAGQETLFIDNPFLAYNATQYWIIVPEET